MRLEQATPMQLIKIAVRAVDNPVTINSAKLTVPTYQIKGVSSLQGQEGMQLVIIKNYSFSINLPFKQEVRGRKP